MDILRVLLDVRVEQGLGCNPIGQPHQLAMDVADLSGLPALDGPGGMAHHRVAVAGQAMVAEGRSSQPALLLPELTFAGQQPLSEQRRDMAPEKAVLAEVAVISDEDLFNVVGPVQEQGRPRPEPYPDHVPILAGAHRQKAQGIARQFGKATNQGQAFRTWWTPVQEDPSVVEALSHGSALSSQVRTKSFEPLASIAQSSCRVVIGRCYTKSRKPEPIPREPSLLSLGVAAPSSPRQVLVNETWYYTPGTASMECDATCR